MCSSWECFLTELFICLALSSSSCPEFSSLADAKATTVDVEEQKR